MLQALRSFQVQGKIEAAERNFTRILAATPNHMHARIGLGYCAWLTGDRVRAGQVLGEAAALELPDEDAVLDCAAALAYIGQCQTAEGLLAGRRQTPRLLAARGAIAEQQGDDEGAAAFYEAALADDDQPAEVGFHRLIAVHRHAGRFDAALALADRLEAVHADRPAAAAFSRGQTFVAMGRSADAITAFQAGLAADPTSEVCLMALVREWRRLGQHEEAAALLADGPETATVLLERSDLALAMRDPDGARRLAEAAHHLHPKRPEALVRLCRIEIDQGQYDAARAAVERIPAKEGEWRLQYLRARIDIARAAEDDQQVKTLLEQLVALQPMDAPIRIELARAWRKLGESAAASAELARALDWDPRCLPALGDAGDQAQKDRDYQTALGFYRKALAIASDQVHHHLRLARLLQIMDSDEQVAVLEVSAARFGHTPEFCGDHIRRLREAGRLEEALAAAEKAMLLHPGSFSLMCDGFDLTLRLRPAHVAETMLKRIPARGSREEIALASHRARLAIRQHRRDEARSILDAALTRDPNNRAYLNELFLLSLWRNDLPEAINLQRRLTKLSIAERRMIGETTNGSQSHNGQMVNDMRLDAEAMEALDQARGGTSRGRVRRLMELVRERPDHIPTAQALVVTLAEARRFAPPPLGAVPSGPHGQIPPRVVQYWDEEQLPADLHAYAASWCAINPGYGYRLFNDKSAQAYLRERLPLPVLQAYVRARDATTRADLFRLAVLALDGGIWADMDDRCLKPISQLFRPADRAVFWQERSGHICNNFMAAVPGHPILRRALVTAVTAINRGDHDKVWMLTGPGLITRCFAQEMAAAGDAWSAWLGQVNVIDEFDLWPIVAMHCMAVYKRQGRHWHKQAFQRMNAKRGAAAIAVTGRGKVSVGPDGFPLPRPVVTPEQRLPVPASA